jgi:hypothetical protein
VVHYLLEELHAFVVIVEFDIEPVDGFGLVLFLLLLEDVRIEQLLQLLVGVVDAQLCEPPITSHIKKG